MKIFNVAIVIFILLALPIQASSRSLYTDNAFSDQPIIGNQSYKSTEWIDYDSLFNWPSYQGYLENDKFAAIFNCFGQFGSGLFNEANYADLPSGIRYSSFVTPPGSNSEYLFGGSIWIGGIIGTDTVVSVGADNWTMTREMWPSDTPVQKTITQSYSAADFSLRSVFYDTITNTDLLGEAYFSNEIHRPLGLKIVNKANIWNREPYQDLVVYDMVITNIGDNYIEDGYVGIYLDADIRPLNFMGGFDDDCAGSFHNQGIGYIIDNDGLCNDCDYDSDLIMHPNAIAIKYIDASFNMSDTNFNWWASNGNAAWDFGPRLRPTEDDPWRDFGGFIGTPMGDSNKYYMMRHDEWDYDMLYTETIDSTNPIWMPVNYNAADFANGFDARFMISIGSFDLPPDSSVRLLYTIFTGDSVHTDPYAFENYFDPDFPDIYYSRLDFSDLKNNAAIADTLAAMLIDLSNPVTGLTALHQDYDSVTIEWDPHIFNNVTQYNVYLNEYSPGDWPYEGVFPPWFQPDDLGDPDYTPAVSRLTLDNLDTSGAYYINVANSDGAAVGDPGYTLLVRQNEMYAPIIEHRYTFGIASHNAYLEWIEPPGTDVDYYRIYKFMNVDSANAKYRAFYDQGYHHSQIASKDSFDIGSDRYYYYALEPYAVVDSGVTSYTDKLANDGNVYHITAVDKLGFETDFSDPILFNIIAGRDKDILVIIPRITKTIDFVEYDTVAAYYDSLLTGYDYDIFNVGDSIKSTYCDNPGTTSCLDWHDLMRYKMILIEDGLFDDGFMKSFEQDTEALTRYILSGGSICMFDAVHSYVGMGTIYSFESKFYSAENTILQEYFGIDSVYLINLDYYFSTATGPLVDSTFGFVSAIGIDNTYPDLDYIYPDSYPFYQNLMIFWPNTSAPVVPVVIPDYSAEPIYFYYAIDPEASIHHGQVVGLKHENGLNANYYFGFNLWYMNPVQARVLIDNLMDNIYTDVTDNSQPILPDRFSLGQNYPNPFNPSTTFEYYLPNRGDVKVDIYNILGREVRCLVNEIQSAGLHRVTWDGTDKSGGDVASGVYFYSIKYEENTYARKMVLLR